MSGLTVALVAADARRSPWRVAMTAALIAAAGALVAVGTLSVPAGVALAGAVTWAVSVGSSDDRRRTVALLAANGARPRTIRAFGLGSALLPGALAFPVLLAGSVAPAPALLLAVAVPGAAGLFAAASPAAGLAWISSRRRRLVVAVLAALVVLVLVPFVGVVLVPALLAAVVARRSPIARGLVGLALVAGATAVVSQCNDWLMLLLALFLAGPAAAIGVAMLGSVAFDSATTLARRATLPFQLATTGLTRHRRMASPLVAGLTVACAALAVNGVLAASFAAREAGRPTIPASVTVTAGTGAGQAVGQTIAPDPIRSVTALRDAAKDPDVAVVGIAEVVDLASATEPLTTEEAQARALTAKVLGPTEPNEGAVVISRSLIAGPNWVGTATAADLLRLGLAGPAADIAAGRAVIFNSLVPEGAVLLAGPSGPVGVTGRHAGGAHIATSFPAVLVGPEVARRIGAGTSPRTIVAVARPGHVVSQARLDDAVTAAITQGEAPAVAQALGILSGQRDDVHRFGAPRAGDEPTAAERSGRLDEIPLFGRTRAEATRPLAPVLLLTLVITLAIVVLLLESTRAEDEVLSLQGAPARMRVRVAAVQAALLAGVASILGAAVGLAMVIAGLETFNRRNPGIAMPDVPIRIPWAVPATLVLLPLGAALAAALVVGLRGRPTPADLADRLDGLAGTAVR